MAKTVNIRLQHKHDKEANWLQATGFTPLDGELIIYDKDDNYNYERVKIGNGIDNVNSLPFTKEGIINIESLGEIQRVGLYNLNGNKLYSATYGTTQGWVTPKVGLVTREGFELLDQSTTTSSILTYRDSTGGTGHIEISKGDGIYLIGTCKKDGVETPYSGYFGSKVTFDKIFVNENGNTNTFLRALGIIYIEILTIE